jgi:signal transduction histidine kinase
LALLILLQRARSPLRLPLALLAIDLFTWNFADLAYSVSGKVIWHWIDRATSPFCAPLAFHVVLIFVGRARSLRHLIALAYALFASLAFSMQSDVWVLLFLGAVVITMSAALGFLLVHLRHTTDGVERARTRLVLAAIGVGAIFGSFDLWYDLLPMPIALPPLSNVGTLVGTIVFAMATMRFRLFGREEPMSLAFYALALASLGTLGYLAVFHWFQTSGAITVLGGATVGLLVVAAARELRFSSMMQRERVQQLATMGRFSQQLAHDLKNPLAALHGSVQFLKKERSRGRSLADHDEYIDLMADQVARLRRTVDDYQRIGRMEPIREPVELNDLVRSVLALQPFAAGDSIAIKLQLFEHLPTCMVDRDLIAGALENLLRNSFEAMPKGGEIAIRTEAIPKGVALVVEDQGDGMDARQLERAFDDFFTTKATGSGLGLAFVRRVAQVHGGHVSMTSELGRGTVVRLEVPCEPK